MTCPYQDQLSVVMEKTYGIGNINASLFATEGIASVGAMFRAVGGRRAGLSWRSATACRPDCRRDSS